MASELEVGKITTGAGTGGDDPKVIVGGEGNAQLRARHIDGKGSTNSNTGKLFLNHYSTSDITMAVGGGNVGINTSSIEAGWSTSCAPIVEISGTKPTLILEEPSVGEFSFVTKNGNLYISDEENNAARLTISSTGLATFSNGITVDDSAGGMAQIQTGGAITIADDASITLSTSSNQGALVTVYDTSSGGAVLFFVSYNFVAQIISDPDSFGSATDTDGKWCMIKTTNSHSMTFKNRSGSSKTFRIAQLGGILTA